MSPMTDRATSSAISSCATMRSAASRRGDGWGSRCSSAAASARAWRTTTPAPAVQPRVRAAAGGDELVDALATMALACAVGR